MIDKLRAEVDWTKPTAKAAVEDVLRQLAYGYVTGYLENGNSALAVYLDSAKPTVVGTEFESMIPRMPTLTEYQPELWRMRSGARMRAMGAVLSLVATRTLANKFVNTLSKDSERAASLEFSRSI
jgi:hypothetical protein